MIIFRIVLILLWLAVLMRIAITDLQTLKIPDRWNLILAATGILSLVFNVDSGPAERVAGVFVISLPMLIMDFIIPGGFGGGDIKLMAAAGLFLGWKKEVLAALLAFLAAGFFAVYLLLTGKAGRKDCFAFGPFLCGGLAFSALAGDRVVMWYMSRLLY